MKKKIFAVLALLCWINSFLFGQTRQEHADIVVMMDISGTILPYYDDINKRVLNEINSKFIREGDMIHIISFNATARHELSQEVKSEADLSRIVSRFMLLYQLGQNSDLISALDYGYNFTQNLQTANKEKILIIISDGIFNPPATSKYAQYSPTELKNKISAVANDIRSENWKVYFVKLPFPDNTIIRNLDGEVISGIAETAHTATGNAANASDTAASFGKKDNETKNDSRDSGEYDYSRSNSSESKNAENAGNAMSSNTAGTQTDNANGTENPRQSSDTSTWINSGNEDNLNNGKKTDLGSENTSGTSQKDYNDISGDVTNSLGINSSDLPEDKNTGFTIHDDTAKLPRVQFPLSLTAEGTALNIPLKITNGSDEAIELKLESISLSQGPGTESSKLAVKIPVIQIAPGETAAVNAAVQLPKESFPRGNYDTELRLNFADNKAVLPQVASLPMSVVPTWFERFYESGKFWIYLGIAALILLLLLLLLFWYLRRNTASPVSHAVSSAAGAESLSSFSSRSGEANREIAAHSSDYAQRLAEQNREEAKARSALLNQTSDHYAPQYTEQHLKVRRNQSGMTEIYVFNQSRSIGKRNIHVMKPGAQLSVGGGKGDDFLIFLVRFPSNLASVRYDGKDYHLYIHKPQYFPYVKGQTVDNCIGKTITVVSDKGYHVGFTFREYEDPIQNLNTILTSINYT